MLNRNAFVSECKIGYSGPNCSKSCVYPAYGLKCSLQCNCFKENCNFRSGCLDIPTSKSIIVLISIATVCPKLIYYSNKCFSFMITEIYEVRNKIIVRVKSHISLENITMHVLRMSEKYVDKRRFLVDCTYVVVTITLSFQ